MGLYSQGNPFSWKMIIGTFLALILNFSMVGHGGGVRLILAYEAHGFTSILEKRHIFKATWGAFMGGRMEGRWNGGADGGATFGIHGGALGGASQLLLKHFLTQKLRFFEMNVILIIKYWRPPHAPPHNVTCEIWKYERWPWTTIKNHVYTIISHVYKLSWASIWDF